MLKVSIDDICINFVCPQCDAEHGSTVADILAIGAPVCTDCDEPMEPDHEVEIDC
jgi:transcription elongation factor Elf1